MESSRLTVEYQERDEKMKNESSIPVAAIGGVAVGGAVLATAAVFQAYELGQSLDLLVQGRTAAIMHLVLRGAMRNAVLCAAFAVACWQYWRMPSGTWRKLLPLLLIAKLGAAVFAASSVSRACSMLAMRLFPALMDPFVPLGGWRPFQMLDLALLFVLMLLFAALADRIQRKIEATRSRAWRAALATLAVCLFVALASSAPLCVVREFLDRQPRDAVEKTDDPPPPEGNDYRIDADEPWEVNA